MWKVLEIKGIAWVRLISDVIWARARITCIAQHSGPKAHIPTSQRTTLKSVPAALVRHSLRKLQLWNGKYQYIHYALYIYTFILMLLYNPCILLLILFLERRCKAALDWQRNCMFVEWACRTDRERERFGPHCGFQRANAMGALVSSVHSCIGKKQPRYNPAVAAGVLLARGVLTHL